MDQYLQEVSQRARKTEQWPAIHKLWVEGDWNDIKGETSDQRTHACRAAHYAYSWLHSKADTGKMVGRLQAFRRQCSARCRALIDAAIEEMKEREGER